MFLGSVSYAHLARPYNLSVEVVNQCENPIAIHVENNQNSSLSYDLTLAASTHVSKNFSVTDDEEVYTLSYLSTSCKIDYAAARDNWNVSIVFSGCDKKPACRMY